MPGPKGPGLRSRRARSCASPASSRRSPGDLTFVANPKYQAQLATTRASAVIVGERVPTAADRRAPCCAATTRISRSRAPSACSRRHAPPAPGIDPTQRRRARRVDRRRRVDWAVRDDRRRRGDRRAHDHLSATSSIGPGARSARTASSTRRSRSASACRSAIASSCRTASSSAATASGSCKQADGTHLKIPQHADVVIEDDVEIGANTTIDRPAVGETRIGAGTKIDNLVQIAPRRDRRPPRAASPRRSASPAARSSKTT